MRRLLILPLLICLLFVVSNLAHAVVGSLVQATPVRLAAQDGHNQTMVLTVVATADSGTAAFPTTGGAILNPITLGIRGWRLESVETDPGGTAPTANYDITIVDSLNFDVAGGMLANRSAASTEKVYLASVGRPIFHDTWTITITNNVVNSAVVTLVLTFVER